jgi:hypothetical protein
MGHGPGLPLTVEREADGHGLGLADPDIEDSISGLLLQPDLVLNRWHLANDRARSPSPVERLDVLPDARLDVLPHAPSALLGMGRAERPTRSSSITAHPFVVRLRIPSIAVPQSGSRRTQPECWVLDIAAVLAGRMARW